MTADHRTRPHDRLRKALYRSIRTAVDQFPLRAHRSVVVEVLATMAAEQAAIVVEEPQQAGEATARKLPPPS